MHLFRGSFKLLSLWIQLFRQPYPHLNARLLSPCFKTGDSRRLKEKELKVVNRFEEGSWRKEAFKMFPLPLNHYNETLQNTFQIVNDLGKFEVRVENIRKCTLTQTLFPSLKSFLSLRLKDECQICFQIFDHPQNFL